VTQPSENEGIDDTQSGATGTGASGAEVDNPGGKEVETKPATQSAAEETVAKADHEAAVARMKAADQRAAKFEAELKAIRDKDLPAQEKLARDHEELKVAQEKLASTNNVLALENAFLKVSTFKWKDPEAALKLADLSGVEIGADGKVSGLEAALKKLAADKKYLLEDKKDDEEDDEKERPGAGAPPMGARKAADGPDKGKLKKTYSALRNRG
jgi:hypothetical protein